MSRYDEPVNSREALLRSKDEIPLRTSLEEAYKSSSEDDGFSDYDSHEWKDRSINLHDKTKRYKKEYSALDSSVYAYEKTTRAGRVGTRLKRIGRYCRPTKRCLFITFVILGLLILLLAGSGFLVYKHAPKDGVNLPILSLNGVPKLISCSNPHRGIHLPEEGHFNRGKPATRRQRLWLRK